MLDIGITAEAIQLESVMMRGARWDERCHRRSFELVSSASSLDRYSPQRSEAPPERCRRAAPWRRNLSIRLACSVLEGAEPRGDE